MSSVLVYNLRENKHPKAYRCLNLKMEWLI